ncbi:18718_t:CDS:10 [Acaulospora morrowiae]|uniref:18718_t:CDS:1 n=1 Tax=Acaulospora morrowiae TaxID=94023 RepID=A0A9N8VE40_9GLOM|nr:18718_t:CDS:10 [Acaulospora morrowiae]
MVRETMKTDTPPEDVPGKDKTKTKEGKNTKTDEEKDKKDEVEELSEEDLQLKNELEMLVERLKEENVDLHKPALESLRTLIRTSTSSMTSVPKPLKFLRPHYAVMTEVYENWPSSDNKLFLADILSVLAMTYDEGKRDSLKFRLKGSREDPGSWGHEYVRHLSTEIGQEYASRQENEMNSDDLMALGLEIVPFFLKHNAEADAVDLLLELEAIDKLPQFVDKDTYARVCLYMVSCVNLLAPPDDIAFLRTAHEIYRLQDKFTEAVTLAIRLGDHDLIRDDFNAAGELDPLLQKQLAFLLARQQISLPIEDEEIQEILNNTNLTKHFIALAKELDVLEPKIPEDIYKSHLENIRPGFTSGSIDSSRQNLASTFVNAFVNAGFINDKLISVKEGNEWIYKNKDHGMLSAAASIGMIMLWDLDSLSHPDKYLYSDDDNIKAGALLALGLMNTGVRNEDDPAFVLLSEHIEKLTSPITRISAIVGLGLAYAGSNRMDIQELLLPLVSDIELNMDVASLAALSLGMIFVGSCNGDITSTILQTMMERSDIQLKETWGRFMGLGLALLYLGKQDDAEATLETLKAIEHPISKQVGVLVEICSYAGTGNVLKIQNMLHICNDHFDKEKEDDLHQAFAVLGVALIATGEDIGAEMSLRTFNHLMHYGEPVIRQAVPLALGLLCASNPILTVLETLSKYSHDNDPDVAINAIFAMGLVGAGTNNARMAQLLRQLASYYHKEPNCLFMVRIAQGLLHMGKGTISINPFHSDRQLMSPVAMAGLLTTLVAFTDTKTLILGKYHWFLYYLTAAMYPRFLITLDENLKSLPVTVRVGQAVDVVGQAGRPKTITGFQTHSTPVLLAHSERAELATEEYLLVNFDTTKLLVMRELPQKESALFKQILKHYEFKQYKKGLKAAEQILKKFPDHGGTYFAVTDFNVVLYKTLAMKGLFLNHMEKKEEAREFVRTGLRFDLNSHICWHVYGLLHRSDKNYGEALKCYTNALKIDKDNMQILQDYSLLQIQMRNFEAFNVSRSLFYLDLHNESTFLKSEHSRKFKESRHRLLQLKSNHQRYWIGLAISYHLLKNYEIAEEVLKAYEGTLKEKPGPMNFEHSELLLYHNLIIEESGNIQAALDHLESIKDSICDRRSWKEKRAQFLLKLDRLKESEDAYQELIENNPDCYSYYEGLQLAKGIKTHDLTSEQEEKIVTMYKELAQKYPKSNAIKCFPLRHTTGDSFRIAVDDYMRASLRKGVPSLFVNLKKLYEDPKKEIIIEQLVEGYRQCLKKHGTFTQSESTDDVKEPPTAYLWTLYLLSQHYDYKRDTVKALELINEAIEHTPTLVELYMTKGRILKHGGDLSEAMKVMNEARELDLQDRFINSKCSKYMLRNDKDVEAEKTIGLFTRGDAPDPITDLVDMQCMWFSLEEADCYVRQSRLGKALKRFHQIEKHFSDITDDQFDFHTYCLRKVTLRAYLSMLRLEDQLRSHPYYFRAAQEAIKIYVKLYDNPDTAVLGGEEQDFENMTEGEKKKARNKARKEALKKQKEEDGRKEKAKDDPIKKKIEKLQDDDPNGEKLLKTDDPLGEAFKFLQPLQELSPKRIETHLLGFEIYFRKKKYLLALRSLLQAHKIDKENETLHNNVIRFKLEVASNRELHQTITQVVTEELAVLVPGDKPLIKFNEEFIERNKGSIPHLLVGVKSLHLIDSEKKQDATNLLLRVCDDEYKKTRTLQNCISVCETLKFFESPNTNELMDKCREWFPISTYFRKAE